MTEWTRQLIFFMRISDLSAAERRTLRRAFSNFGSGESETDEDKMFAAPPLFSTTGVTPAQAFGISTAAKPAMLAALKSRLDVLPQVLYYVIDNRTGQVGELRNTNDPGVTASGQQWTWQDAVGRVETLRGLVPIVEELP